MSATQIPFRNILKKTYATKYTNIVLPFKCQWLNFRNANHIRFVNLQLRVFFCKHFHMVKQREWMRKIGHLRQIDSLTYYTLSSFVLSVCVHCSSPFDACYIRLISCILQHRISHTIHIFRFLFSLPNRRHLSRISISSALKKTKIRQQMWVQCACNDKI